MEIALILIFLNRGAPANEYRISQGRKLNITPVHH
jgi:hypothetical protein